MRIMPRGAAVMTPTVDKVRRFFWRILAKPLALRAKLISLVVDHPILFIPAAVVYIGLTILNVTIAVGFAFGMAQLFASDANREQLAIASGATYFIFTEIA